jgi:hypothetical protein
METVYFTICARNYLAYARTLGQSIHAQMPDASFMVVLADDPSGTEDYPEILLPMDKLRLPELPDMRLRYTLMELATAIKPASFRHILAQQGVERAIYLDPDIQVFTPLDPVTGALDAGASCVLTPHLLEPLGDAARPADLDILASGTFNLGFAAFNSSAESLVFLAWWQARLVDQGYNDLPRGQFVDQKWMDFAPSFLPRLHILCDPGCNVAYWNLTHRPIKRSGDKWLAGGHPLVFFHFSGAAPDKPDILSKHQSRFTAATAGEAATLLSAYLELLETNGHASWRTIPYAYDRFPSGSPILPVMRRGKDVYGRLPDDANWWHAPSEKVDQMPGQTITRLMEAIHASRPDLQAAFPLSHARGRSAFHTWFLTHGEAECGADAAAMSSALGRPPRKTGNLMLARRLGQWLPAGLRARLQGAITRALR